MSLTREDVIDRWCGDIQRDQFNPKRSYTSGTRHRDLTFLHGYADRFEMDYGDRHIVLGQIYNDRGYIALNGDGLDTWRNAAGTRWQTQFRNRVRAVISRYQQLLIPFAAVAGAGVDLATVRPIHVLQDGIVNDHHYVPAPPQEWLDSSETRVPGEVVVQHDTVEGAPEPMWWAYRHSWNRTVQIKGGETEQSMRGALWRSIQPEIKNDQRTDRWFWLENRHQLGESLFSAVGEDNRRHKYVSAFDRQERNPLYYLAQLPDGSGATTVEEAVRALAPPIVQQAWKDKREVRRQGDVFFVKTELTDTDVYAMAARRVRRDLVFPPRQMPAGGWPNPARGEVRSRVPCPCGCGHTRWSSATPRGLQTLAIYGTAHTASEVVVTKNGRTYARGKAHHDPPVIGEDRQRDHQDRDLGDSWHLCLRNTVPRRRAPRAVETEAEEVTT